MQQPLWCNLGATVYIGVKVEDNAESETDTLLLQWWFVGWGQLGDVCGRTENKAISAFNKVEVKAELGNQPKLARIKPKYLQPVTVNQGKQSRNVTYY